MGPPIEGYRRSRPVSSAEAWDDEEQRVRAAADEKNRRQRQFDTLRGFWEKNVGKLDNTPAVRDMLKEMVAGPAPIDPDTLEGLASLLGNSGADPDALAKWASDQSSLFDKFEVPSLGVRFGDMSLPALDDSTLSGAFGSPSGGLSHAAMTSETTWLPVVLLVAVAAGALFAWRFWPRQDAAGRSGGGPRTIPGLGPWPLDPRQIGDREALVRAFEYLSVLVCGTGARAWNHVTIADALRAAPGGNEAAEPLARLYALARYAPAGVPLPTGAIAEARGHLCRLAGVPAP
jgi:hypothetical protein